MYTILGIIESGEIDGIEGMEKIASELKTNKAIMPDSAPFISHYWLLRTTVGDVAYFGTPETFAEFRKEAEFRSLQ